MQVNIFIRLLIYCLSVLLHMLIAVLVLSKGVGLANKKN